MDKDWEMAAGEESTMVQRKGVFEERATECTECRTKPATEHTERIEANREGNQQEAISSPSLPSVHSVDSARSVHSVAGETLPANKEGWKVSAFRFTRGLKFDCGMDGVIVADVRPHVEQWYEAAKSVIGDVPFSEVWCEVVTSWDRAKRSAFEDPLAEALAKAREDDGMPPMPVAAGYDEPVVALAYRLLFWLAVRQEWRFFISCRALGECLGVDHTRAWRVLRMFEADGVVVCLWRGRMPKASRFRWNGMEEAPEMVRRNRGVQ